MPRYRSKKNFCPFNANPNFENFLQDQIMESKKGLLYSNAIFLAELLQQTKPSKKNKVTLGELHYQRGNYDKVVGLLRKCDSDKGRYLLGMSLYKLKRLDEAEKALVMKYCVINEFPKRETEEKRDETKEWIGKAKSPKIDLTKKEGEGEGIKGLKENSEPLEEVLGKGEGFRAFSEKKKKKKKGISIFR